MTILFCINISLTLKHHSTWHAIITLVERDTKALDTGVFLDQKNAFDAVDHCILLNKLGNIESGPTFSIVLKVIPVFHGSSC